LVAQKAKLDRENAEAEAYAASDGYVGSA